MNKKNELVEPELREARGYLMDVISHALSQMNGHVEIEHTELPSVPMKGDFWKEEGGNVYMELIKGEHNLKDAMFHDVHAEEYTLDEVINKLDYSETYALTIAVREAQIKDIVSTFDGQEIYFDEPVAVSRDDNDIEKDYVAGVKIDDDGSLNISGHKGIKELLRRHRVCVHSCTPFHKSFFICQPAANDRAVRLFVWS